MDMQIQRRKLVAHAEASRCVVSGPSCCGEPPSGSQPRLKLTRRKLRLPGEKVGAPFCVDIPASDCCDSATEGGQFATVGIRLTKQRIRLPIWMLMDLFCTTATDCACDLVMVPCLGATVPRFYTITTFKFSSGLAGRTICTQSVVEYQSEGFTQATWIALGDQYPASLSRCGAALSADALVSSTRGRLGIMALFSPTFVYLNQFTAVFPPSPWNAEITILEAGDTSVIDPDLYNSFDPLDGLPDCIGFYHPYYDDYIVMRKNANLSYGGMTFLESTVFGSDYGPHICVFRYGEDYLLFWGNSGFGFLPEEQQYLFWGVRVGDTLQFEIPGGGQTLLPAGTNTITLSARTWPFPLVVPAEAPRPGFWKFTVPAPYTTAHTGQVGTSIVKPISRAYSDIDSLEVMSSRRGGRVDCRLVHADDPSAFDQVLQFYHTKPHPFGTDADFELSWIDGSSIATTVPYTTYTVDGVVHRWVYTFSIAGIPITVEIHT
ncbi:hypothetical protein [Tuwongella immobilis]|uniref:Uncharacterized protein n=1 Tax=Tuwongella immobilis TaxID=692036 RepID=A0A6C2YPE9_9BACT|nr:hypothetical protein [Tuwongella immobilis]VIP03059.1 unnamed protein product [Tuwongella immobilis]VTS03264.1 unnamed protein product [Tuwongella immobilis]